MAQVIRTVSVVSYPAPANSPQHLPTFTCTEFTHVNSLHAAYTASATVGTRAVVLQYQDANGIVLADVFLGAVTAGNTGTYNLLAPQFPRLTLAPSSAIYITDTANIATTTTSSSGVCTSTSATTLTDSTKAWTNNQWVGYTVTLGNATAAVTSNSATVLTFTGTWQNTLVAGTAEASDATTMTDSDAAWTVNEWVGYLVGMGGSVAYVTSNTATVLTFVSGWDVAAPTTGAYKLYGMAYVLSGDVVTASASEDLLGVVII